MNACRTARKTSNFPLMKRRLPSGIPQGRQEQENNVPSSMPISPRKHTEACNRSTEFTAPDSEDGSATGEGEICTSNNNTESTISHHCSRQINEDNEPGTTENCCRPHVTRHFSNETVDREIHTLGLLDDDKDKDEEHFTIEVDTDATSVTSSMSMEESFGQDEYDYTASIAFETIPAVADFVEQSWTIYTLNHVDPGDTMWFRVFANGQHRNFLEVEDTEILTIIQALSQRRDCSSFYIAKWDGSGDIILVPSSCPMISCILKQLLEQSKTQGEITLPVHLLDSEQLGETELLPKQDNSLEEAASDEEWITI